MTSRSHIYPGPRSATKESNLLSAPATWNCLKKNAPRMGAARLASPDTVSSGTRSRSDLITSWRREQTLPCLKATSRGHQRLVSSGRLQPIRTTWSLLLARHVRSFQTASWMPLWTRITCRQRCMLDRVDLMVAWGPPPPTFVLTAKSSSSQTSTSTSTKAPQPIMLISRTEVGQRLVRSKARLS